MRFHRFYNTVFHQIEENESEIRRMSGSSIPASYVSSGSSFDLVFHSDGSITGPGFQLNFKRKQILTIEFKGSALSEYRI